MPSRSILVLIALVSLAAAACTGGGRSTPADADKKSDRAAAPSRADGVPRLLGVDVVDARTAYAFGGVDLDDVHSVVLKSTDGGATWTTVLRVGPKSAASGIADVQAIDFVDAANGVALDEDGVLYVTADGGASWTAVGGGQMTLRFKGSRNDEDPEARELSGVHFADARTGFVYGLQWIAPAKGAPAGSPKSRAAILRTTDGGATWKPATIEGPSASMAKSGSRATSEDLWAVGGDARLAEDSDKDALFRSKDGGATWQRAEVKTGMYLTDVTFVDALRGFLVGERQDATGNDVGTEIYTTDDGGSTWRVVAKTSVPLYGVRFADVRNGIAVGAKGTVLTTSDGGATWVEHTVADTSSAGPLVAKPDQTGASEDELSALFYGIALVEPGHGWVATDEGIFEYRRK